MFSLGVVSVSAARSSFVGTVFAGLASRLLRMRSSLDDYQIVLCRPHLCFPS